MAKATHLGTCQLCGREQKLPGGTLSTHGYTVEWSMFLGTCPGTGYKPFEQSIDRIEKAIEDHEASASWAEAQAVEWVIQRDVVALQKHVPARWEGRRKVKADTIWVIIETARISEDLRFWTDDEDNQHQTGYYGYGPERGLDELVAQKNARYAETFIAKAQKHREYCRWQRERIANWKPSDLKPVPPEDARPAGECPGSRELGGYTKRYVRCPVCQKTVSNDYRSGRIRSHKPD